MLAAVLICDSTDLWLADRQTITLLLGPSKTQLLCRAGKPTYMTSREVGRLSAK